MTSALRVAAGAATVAFRVRPDPGVVRVGGQSLTAVDETSNRPTPRPRRSSRPQSLLEGHARPRPVGNIGKESAGFKLPLTPAGEAALAARSGRRPSIPSRSASSGASTAQCQRPAVDPARWPEGGVPLLVRLSPPDPRSTRGEHTRTILDLVFRRRAGQWDRDTLVIDSIGFKDEKVWIDETPNPHSDALHVVERWTRPRRQSPSRRDRHRGSEFYTRPFNYARTWVLGKPDEELPGPVGAARTA